MDHRVEPPSWLPEGAAPEADDEVSTNGFAPGSAGGQESLSEADRPGLDSADSPSAGGSGDSTVGNGADVGEDSGVAAGEQDLAGHDSLAGTDSVTSDSPLSAGGFSVAGQEPSAGEADPFTPRPEGVKYPYGRGCSRESEKQRAYRATYAAERGYTRGGTTQPAAEDPPVPPYPAEVASQAATAASSMPTLAAAYRALPKPRFKTRPATKSRGAATSARRANLVVARFEPWSVMKFSFLMSLVAWVVLFVAVALLYYMLSALGVFAAIQKTLESITSSQTSAGVNLSKWTSPSRVLGYTMLIGAVNIVIITALSTVGAMIYNLVTHLGGGVEVTLKETD